MTWQPATPLAARARAVAIQLTQWPSVTGTPGEAALPAHLASLLGEHPYFRANPTHLSVLPIEGDPHGRCNVFALVRGGGDACVALSGHFDTVPTDDYADLAPLATEPEALRGALLARLDASGAYPLARADLASGDYLPGRGLLDMKSGLAAGIAVLEAFAAEPDRDGNLLLIATPDEEDRSAGMRAAADALPAFLARHGLAARLAINLDALIDNGDGAGGRILALGCVGKLLLSALVVGRDAHACYPLQGVNAAYLAAELVCALECAPELGEQSGAEIAAPPTVLGSRDLKTVYNVTTPSRVWANWNVLTQRRPAAEVLDIATDIARATMRAARRKIAERAAKVAHGPGLSEGWDVVPVLSFATLRERAAARDPDFAARFATEAAALAARADLDFPGRCRALTELAWDAAGEEGPAIVLGYASLPYPAVNFPTTPDGAALEARIRAAADAAAVRHGTTVAAARHLPVIVDMSFLGNADADDLRAAAANTPIWGSSIVWDLSGAATPGIPSINLGPWGRDYHHWLERVHQPYAFGVLPELVRDVARAALAAPLAG